MTTHEILIKLNKLKNNKDNLISEIERLGLKYYIFPREYTSYYVEKYKEKSGVLILSDLDYGVIVILNQEK